MYIIDLYRKSFLSQSGKDAGNMPIIDFSRMLNDKYSKWLKETKEIRENPKENINSDNELYL